MVTRPQFIQALNSTFQRRDGKSGAHQQNGCRFRHYLCVGRRECQREINADGSLLWTRAFTGESEAKLGGIQIHAQ